MRGRRGGPQRATLPRVERTLMCSSLPELTGTGETVMSGEHWGPVIGLRKTGRSRATLPLILRRLRLLRVALKPLSRLPPPQAATSIVRFSTRRTGYGCTGTDTGDWVPRASS